MGTIQYWQLATDGLLVLALFFLAIRFTRSGASQVQGRSIELERGLRALVKEADKAGRVLNDTLMQRQSELQSLLRDLQDTEDRVSEFESKATDLGKQLSAKLESAQGVVEGIESTVQMLETQAAALTQTFETRGHETQSGQTRRVSEQPPEEGMRRVVPTPLAAAVERTTYAVDPEPVSFQQPQAVEQRTPAMPASGTRAASGRVNIYGEPIQAPTAARRPVNQQHGAYQPSSEIRNAPESELQREPAVAASMKQIYDAAEQLLRAGYDLQTVSAKTRLSIDEVRMLSQMVADKADSVTIKSQTQAPRVRQQQQMYQSQVERDAEAERQSPVFAPNEVTTVRDDDRLGVLGSMKRDRYTV